MSLQKNTNFDVIIIGGGAAGLSSALWCDELGLKTLLLEQNSEPGGQLLYIYNQIKNHLGVAAENGLQLRDIFLKQTAQCKFTRKFAAEISRIDLKSRTIYLVSGEILSSGIIILATGVSRRKLKIKGEKEFQNKGIIESGKRDQTLVAGKNVVVIGGGDAAFENALILAETSAKVTLIHRGKSVRARSEFVEKAKKNSKIKILLKSVAEEIIGNEKVEKIKLKNLSENKTQILPVESILIRIGVEPNTELFCDQIECDEQNYVKINQTCATNLNGIFAVGDVANPLAPTVSSAVGMGATAAKVIAALLKNPDLQG